MESGRRAVLGLLAGAIPAARSWAQAWPARPVRVIVNFPDRDLEAKFRGLCEGCFTEDRIAAMIEACWGIRSAADAGALARLAAG